MGPMVKGKKKGRPSKADPGDADLQDAERDVRRSLRRRSVKYVFDLDDYFDEDESVVDDEDQRRREKKLQLLLQLQIGGEQESTADRQASASPSKKRKIEEELDEDLDEENDEANQEEDCDDEDEEEVRETRRDLKVDSPPGTPAEAQCGQPQPHRKALEIILDKLQRKDIYGVYAEPVDPEELPDYHDAIEHPMDFATVRNNLRNGSYATFEQFENDVFLICSNAMQYNAPDTIYYKQARSIQELAKRKFHKIRLSFERNDKVIKSEQKAICGSLSKKQIKRPLNRTVQEPVGSDFSSGDIQNAATALQASGLEKPGAVDGLVEGSSFMNDNNLDIAEDSLPGRGTLSRFGRRSSFVQDENRRTTYNISLSQPVPSSESVFSTFDSETKQLTPVGLYSDHSYPRSLARFAATLGSVAWELASKRIEQAIPQGFKYGQGWVGEYEPPPTPVLMLENCSIKEPPFLAKVQPRTSEKVPTILNSSKESPANIPFFEQKFPFLGPAGIRSPASVITTQPIRGSASETKPSFFLSPEIRPSGSHNLSKNADDSAGNRPFSRISEVEASRPMELSSKNINFSKSGSFKQTDHRNGVASGVLPNGKAVGNRVDGADYPPEQGQGLRVPVQLMRMQADHNQQKTSNQSSADASQVIIDDPNNAATAAARAWMAVGAGGLRPVTEKANPNTNHRYNDPPHSPANIQSSQVSRIRGEFPSSSMHDKSSAPILAFVPQGPIPMLVGNHIQFRNQGMIFPPADLSRFQLQSSWRNAGPQMHSRQKQESLLPPDLNIGFQASGSPGRPSSGGVVDLQQPDLALQL